MLIIIKSILKKEISERKIFTYILMDLVLAYLMGFMNVTGCPVSRLNDPSYLDGITVLHKSEEIHLGIEN